MNLLVTTTFLLVLGSVHGAFNIGPCANHQLDGQSCSFGYNAREQTCTAGTFSLYYQNCDRECDLPCDLHPPRNSKCDEVGYTDTCTRSILGYCQKDCGVSTYVTSYSGCPGFPNWLSCADYCCCDACGPPGPPGPPTPESCPYYTRRFPGFGTCQNRKGPDNDQVCPGVKCPSNMYYLDERCVCITKQVFGPASWPVANAYCADNYPGGHLMLMRFASEETFIQNNYTPTRIWIGISGAYPVYRYRPDDREVTADMWGNGEPNGLGGNELCVEYWNGWYYQYTRYGWNDHGCSSSFHFICEMEPYVMRI